MHVGQSVIYNYLHAQSTNCLLFYSKLKIKTVIEDNIFVLHRQLYILSIRDIPKKCHVLFKFEGHFMAMMMAAGALSIQS